MKNNTYKIFRDNKVELVTYDEYAKWLLEEGSFYFLGPDITDDNREIYTSFTANTLEKTSFCTFEVFLNEYGVWYKDRLYNSPDWASARKLHQRLVSKVRKPAELELVHHE